MDNNKINFSPSLAIKKKYSAPEIIYQQPLETRAGSSGGGPS